MSTEHSHDEDLGLWLPNPLTAHCGDCRYLRGIFDGSPFLVCMYLSITGEKRGCPGDAHCTKRAPKEVAKAPCRRIFRFGKGMRVFVGVPGCNKKGGQ